MKTLVTTLFLTIGSYAFPQTAPSWANNAEEIPVLRKQIFGGHYPSADVKSYTFDTSDVAVFGYGYVLTREEFLYVFYNKYHTDSTEATQAQKTKALDEIILNRQKMLEAMDQKIDTSSVFQLEFLMYKQSLITPYLNEGKTRLEAEALPAVKYALRQYYCDRMVNALKTKEIWTQDTDVNLREFFDAHPELYQGQPFDVSKTKVVHDYNKKLETELNARVRSKFPYATNPKVLSKL